MTLGEARKKYKIDGTELHELTQEDVDVLLKGVIDYEREEIDRFWHRAFKQQGIPTEGLVDTEMREKLLKVIIDGIGLENTLMNGKDILTTVDNLIRNLK